MQIRGEGLADEQGQGLTGNDKTFYVMHPNCAVEEMG
jgi:DNA replication licensing factor MCM6